MTDKQPRAWELEKRETLYRGFYQLDKLWFRHTLHEGGWSNTVDREQFVRGNVTAVLPYDPNTDQVVLIEQFRIGAMNQQPDPWMTEVIAGMIEPGEQPEEVAIREAKEEAGLTLTDLQLVHHYLASPGATAEEVFIYFAHADLSAAGGVHGLATEDEDILVNVVAADDAIAMLKSRKINNSISIIAMQWFENYRLQQGNSAPSDHRT